MVLRMRKISAVLFATLVLILASPAAPADDIPAWTITVRPADIVAGDALRQLHTRRPWRVGFDGSFGAFEIALRKTAVPIPAPQCRMDFLILTIPFYYPENPKQASVSERRAVYDAFVGLQACGSGSLTARVEAPDPIARMGRGGAELTACNLFFAFPPAVQVSAP